LLERTLSYARIPKKRDLWYQSLRNAPRSADLGLLGPEASSRPSHFAKYGNWTDDALDVYYAKPWSLWSGIDHYTKGVTAGVNFLTAFDAKCQKSMEAILAFESQAQKLNDAGELDKLTEEGVRSRGVRIAEIIKDIHEKAEDAEKFLWWTARSTEALDSLRFAFGSDWEAFAKAAEACEKCHGYLEKFGGPLGKGVGAADNIVKGYETYQRATRAGFSEGAAAAIATLQKAMEFVPVFGELYANVLGAVPEITQLAQNHVDEIRNAALQLGLQYGR
jgi:hypothetical protein